MLFKCLTIIFFITYIEAQYDYGYRPQVCPQLHLDHGRVRIKSRPKLVKFMCSIRYEIVGNRYATCRNGAWDVPMPVCVKPGCPELPKPANAIQMKEHHDAWVVTFCMPGFRLIGSTAIYCNGYKWNATSPTCIGSSSVSSLSCDFEDPYLCGWTQDELHDFDWIRLNKKTPSSFMETGPTYDHTLGKGRDGYYMYIESTSKQDNETARLVSPIFDSNLTINGCFSFYFHMYGNGIGGLRVYQKPDNMQLADVLKMTSQDKAHYVLFELWGNQGDLWLSAAPKLKTDQGNRDFQIVIEGIRGSSFTSDIAIDDIAILQGENCTNFVSTASTTTLPPTILVSCAGRCDVAMAQPYSCDCTITCLTEENCCPDFIELCMFNAGAADPSPDEQPQTEKLVGISTTTPETTITPEPTTTSTTVTTPTTQTTKLTTHTTKLTTQTTKLTTQTTKLTTKTTPTTTITTSTKTTKPVPTPPTPETTKVIVTTTKLTTKLLVPTSTVPTMIAVNSDEKKHEKEINVQRMATDKQETTGSSKWKTPMITIVVLAIFASLVYLAVYSRTANGRAALARLRGRTSSHDSEVRYLTSDHDDL